MAQKDIEILIGSDHYGLELKNGIKKYLIEKGYQVHDVGVNNSDPVLYPEIAVKLCNELLEKKLDRGLLICGTGAGMAIVANKIPGIRAVCIHDAYTAERAKASNDAQIATLGSQVVSLTLAEKLVDIWLMNEFQGGRSLPKVELINQLDEAKKR
jgi:ribose 5-phosphate isomerase B